MAGIAVRLLMASTMAPARMLHVGRIRGAADESIFAFIVVPVGRCRRDWPFRSAHALRKLMGEQASRGRDGAGRIQGEPLATLSLCIDSDRSMNQHVAVLVALALPLLAAWPTGSVLLKMACIYRCLHRGQAGERVGVADGVEFFTVLGERLARIVDGSWAGAGSRRIAPAALSFALAVLCTHLRTAMPARCSFPLSCGRTSRPGSLP